MLVSPPPPPPSPADARPTLPVVPPGGPLPAVDPLPAASGRQRLVIVLLTAAVGLGLWGSLVYRPGWHLPDQRACRPGETTDCVGGLAQVVLLPAAAASADLTGAASGPRRP